MSKCIKCGNEILTGDIHWEMGLCNNCYNEIYCAFKRIELEIKGCLDREKNLEKENQQLKQQLAEKEKYTYTGKEVGEIEHNYEKQLAEKDRQIEQLKKFDGLNKTFFDLFRTAFKEPNKVDDLFNTLKTIQEKQDQDKIWFAIDKLVGVQKYIDDKAIYIEEVDFGREIKDFIDNQIKELKKELE